MLGHSDPEKLSSPHHFFSNILRNPYYSINLPPTNLPPTNLPPTNWPPTNLPPTNLPPTNRPPTNLPQRPLPVCLSNYYQSTLAAITSLP